MCTHHKIEPTRLLSALLTALARYRLFGHDAFPNLTLSDPKAGPDVYCEIQALMIHAEEPLDPASCAPRSLMEAVALCVDFDRRQKESLADELTANDDNSAPHDNGEWMKGTLLGGRAREQYVLLLAFKECMNQIEAMSLEMAIEREKGSETQ